MPFSLFLTVFQTVQITNRGAVAQLGARVNGIHEVAGSIPASSTKPHFGRTVGPPGTDSHSDTSDGQITRLAKDTIIHGRKL